MMIRMRFPMKYLLKLVIILTLVACGACGERNDEQVSQEYSKSYNLVKDSGRFRTLNQTGWIVNDLDEISEAFLDSIDEDSKVLEIGAGFGYVSLKAVEKGAEVYINDVDQRHLNIIREHVPLDKSDKLHFIKVRFPANLNIANGTLDAILA